MPSKLDLIKINNPVFDRRVKLYDSDKEDITVKYKTGLYSLMALANEYGVSKRLIQFVIHPERLLHNKVLRVARGGWKLYYNKITNNQYKRKHRQYKKCLYERNLIA